MSSLLTTLRRQAKLAFVLLGTCFYMIKMIPFGIQSYFHYRNSPYITKDIRYGKNPRSVLDVYRPAAAHNKKNNPAFTPAPTVIFLHGGAWGFGDKFQYTLMGKAIMNHLNAVAVVPNYSLSPKGTVTEMVEDTLHSILWTIQNIQRFGGDPKRILLCGHSAGAHLFALTLIESERYALNSTKKEGDDLSPFHCLFSTAHEQYGSVPSHQLIRNHISCFVSLSGVFDINHHFEHEASRGVEEFSPMQPAMLGKPNFHKFSPTKLVHQHLAPYSDQIQLPPYILGHGLLDTTVPLSSARKFAESLKLAGIHHSLEEWDNVEHSDVVTDVMSQKKTPATKAVLNMLSQAINKYSA